MFKKKSLGQNFLQDKNIIADIVKASGTQSSDTVLEIGPGEGVLTKVLLETGAKVISVEKDDRLIPVLKEKFVNEIISGQFQLIHQDILECNIKSIILSDLDAVRDGQEKGEEPYSSYGDENFLQSNKEMHQIWKYKVVANIPYYITGQIIRMFLESNKQPESMTLLVQKEVAERIIARDGKESLLSLSVKVFGEPKYIRTVGRGAFSPQPTVDSAVLHIENISKERLGGVRENLFFTVIHAGFAHKRKQLLPNLSGHYPKSELISIFEKCGIDEKARAEDIPLKTWVALCNLLENKK